MCYQSSGNSTAFLDREGASLRLAGLRVTVRVLPVAYNVFAALMPGEVANFMSDIPGFETANE
jgi:hypothetical protein